MGERAKTIAERIRSLGDEVVALVQKSSDADWMKICAWEQWPVGATARHIATNHFTLFRMAQAIVLGEPLPPLTMDQINAAAKQEAAAHPVGSKSEVLALLHENSARMVAFVSALSDEDLDRKGSMPAFGGEVTVEKLIHYVIFMSAARHLESMKKAAAG